MRGSLTAPACAPAFSVAKAESIVETTFDSLVALNAADAGSHGVEKLVEPPGAFSGCVCAIAKPSATASTRPNATLAHLRTMNRSYTRMHERAMRSAERRLPPPLRRARPCRAEHLRHHSPRGRLIHETMQRHIDSPDIPDSARTCHGQSRSNDIEHDRRALVDSGRNVGFMESGPTDGREAVNLPLTPFTWT